MSGVTIGRVESITLDPVTRLATVDFDLDGKLTTLMQNNSKKFKKCFEELRYSSDYTQAMLRNKKKWNSNLLRT
jgi:phospholipid/cholesterol/gamma-HCH transport system substrate-binding protein